MKKYKYRLIGKDMNGSKINGALLRCLLDVLVEGSEKAVRLAFEGRSTAVGKTPEWVKKAAMFNFTGISAGSSNIHIETNELAEVLPERFQQKDLFTQDINPKTSGLDLLNMGLKDAMDNSLESDYIDMDLLKSFSEFRKVLNYGVKSIEMSNAHPGDKKIIINKNNINSIKKIETEIYKPQETRVAGTLDVIGYSGKFFKIILKDKSIIKGISDNIDMSCFSDLFGKPAIISGKAFFKPSGKVFRIEASNIEKAGEEFSFWSKAPKPVAKTIAKSNLIKPQGARSGINAIFGKWPGNESDEEFEKMIKEMS